ncbi:MAG: hypothetical protein AB7K36_31205 [Chloroflexota bacterium]
MGPAQGMRWLVIGALALLLFLAAPRPLTVLAEIEDWQITGLTDGEIVRLQTPASGAFFATVRTKTESGYSFSTFRSDNGGETWQPVSVPPDLSVVRVDPVDHSILYAASKEAFHKSMDGGGTWEQVLPNPSSPNLSYVPINGMAISEADHDVVYLQDVKPISSLRIVRTRDGGATWERALDGYGNSSSCFFVTSALLAHGTDPSRVLLVASCRHPSDLSLGDLSMPLRLSADYGTTWDRVGSLPAGTVTDLIGWRGATPERLYLALRHKAQGENTGDKSGGSSLHRSDDDGHTWTTVLSFTDEGAPEQGTEIGALAYDPAHPDRVYLATGGGVRASTDGGTRWTKLGRQDLPPIITLAPGVDGQNVYAGTEHGLYRLRLTATSEAP